MRIVGKNFRCYEYFDLTFEAGTCNIVIGESGELDYANTNGSGKTTLGIYALCWARYGKYPDMSTADSVVNTWAEKGTEIYHEFNDVQGNPCIIERKRKPNSLKFWQNNTAITGDMPVVQKAIDAAIGCNYDFYTKVFLYTGRDDGKFARMTDGRQKEILDTILPLDFDEPKQLAVDKMGEAQRTSASERSKVTWLEREISDLEIDIQVEKAQSDEWDIRINEDYNAIEESLNQWAAHYTVHFQSHETLKTKGVALNETLQSQHAALSNSGGELDRIQRLIRDEEERLRSLNVAPGICPTCEQTLQTTEAQTKLATKLNGIEDYLAELKSDLPALTQTHNSNEVTYRTAGEAVAAHTIKTTETYELMIAAQNTVADLTIRLNERPDDGVNLHASNIHLMNDQIEKKRQQIMELEKQSELHSADAKLWATVADALGPRGIKHFAFETLCPEMTATARAFLKHLSPNDLDVEFRSHVKKGSKVKEGFYIHATGKNGAKTYLDLSSGEQARIDLVVFLTLFLMATKHVSNTGLVVFDEIADTLDSMGKQMVCHLLDFFSAEYGVTTLILTNDLHITSHIIRGYCCCANGGLGYVEKLLES